MKMKKEKINGEWNASKTSYSNVPLICLKIKKEKQAKLN